MAYGAVLLAMAVDVKRRNHRSVYLILTASAVTAALIMYMPGITTTTYNSIMFPMIFMGITSYILTKNKNRNLFAAMFMLGILYSVALCFSSNQYFYVTAMAITASNVAGFTFTADLIREMKETPDTLDYAVPCKYAAFGLTALVLVLQSAFQITAKAEHCFWESSPSMLNTEISEGPAKGIMTTADNAAEYEEIYSDIKEYTSAEKGNILILSNKTWTYLAVDGQPYGTLSAYVTGENQTSLNRIEMYYEVNPEKVPVYIYIPKSSQWENIGEITAKAQQAGYKLAETEISYKLYK